MEKEMKEEGEDKPKIIKLCYPSFSNTIPFIIWDHNRLDIGSIARAFGLEPATLKLNGYFISRGLDLISSSVTWKSLLSFFSSKRLPIGNSDHDPILVHGKLCKVGLKRGHDSQAIVNGYCCEADEEGSNLNGRRQTFEINLVKNKRMKSRELGSKEVEPFPVSKRNPNGYKRKQYMEDVILLKKLKINETKTDAVRGIDTMNAVSHIAYSCGYNSENMKRMREDEPLVSALCKKTR